MLEIRDLVKIYRTKGGESVLGVYDYFRGSFGFTNIGNGGARPIGYYSDYWIDGFAQVDEGDTFWEERLLTDTDLSELGTDGIIISSHMFDCMCYHGLFDDSPYYGQAYELNDYDDVVGKPLKLNAEDGERVTLTIRGVFPLVSDSFYEANYEHFISGNGLHALNYTIPAHRLGRDLLLYDSDTLHTFLSSARDFNEYPLQDYAMDEHVVRLDGKAASAPLGSGEVIVPFDFLLYKLEPMAETFLDTLDMVQAAQWARAAPTSLRSFTVSPPSSRSCAMCSPLSAALCCARCSTALSWNR